MNNVAQSKIMLAINRQLTLLVLFALFSSIALFELTPLDVTVQNFLYSAELDVWLINSEQPLLRFLLYDGIRQLYIIVALGFILLASIQTKRPLLVAKRREILVICATLIAVPLVINVLKAVTNIPCPKDLILFGGGYPHVTLFRSYPLDFIQAERIRCYPAGHASGGFALMSLALLFASPRKRNVVALSACGLGWVVGLYKMAIGDHFLSHTVVTMLIAMLIILLLDRFIRVGKDMPTPP